MGSQIRAADIKRIHYGYIVAPSGTPDAGQPIPVCGYVVQHPQFAAAAFSERIASNGLDQVGTTRTGCHDSAA